VIGILITTVQNSICDRIAYRLEDGADVFGPYIERRPKDANHQAFVDSLSSNTAAANTANEIEGNLQKILAANGGAVLISLRWSTASQNAARVRQYYQTSTGWECIRIARYINSLGLTDNQLKNLFGINDAQLSALKTKFTNLIAKYNDVQSQAGD
jgi:hypothetical protein